MSDPAASITELHASEQFSFEGMPVQEQRYVLKGVKQQLTTTDLSIGEHVSGTFEGRVVGVINRELGEGTLVRIHEIEVLSANLEA